MLLLVGLGNPGAQYKNHRHNVGFMALDAVTERYNFASPRKRFQGLTADGTIAGEKIIALKPTTFMNDSGQSVGAAMRFYKLQPSDVYVLYDEVDLAAGKLRVKTGGGAAGHNGIRSIDSHIGANFHRVRIGIGHPGAKHQVHSHVLGNFSVADQDWLQPMLSAIADALPELIRGKASNFTTKVALILQPPKEQKSSKDSEDTNGTN